MTDQLSGRDNAEIFGGGQARNIVTGLFDFRFRTMTTMRAAPAMYLLVIASIGVLCSYLIVLAFQDSTAQGLAWLLLVGPAIFLGTAVVMRVVIEFVLAILLLMVRLEETTDAVLQIVDNTTDISAQTLGLPTFPGVVRGLRGLRGLVADEKGRRTQSDARVAAKVSAQEAADRAVQDAVDAAVKRALDQAAARAVEKSLEHIAARDVADEASGGDPLDVPPKAPIPDE